jgi:hypothetical protein
VRWAWRYFDAAALADSLAKSTREFEESSSKKDVGRAPLPPLDNPELALILASVPDAVARTGGDLYAVILNVAVNAWMAGHIHGEDGCDAEVTRLGGGERPARRAADRGARGGYGCRVGPGIRSWWREWWPRP